jgi:predicted nucleic acid-binding Zn ribbon protein
MPTPTPEPDPGSVRTPIMVASCPICGQPLRGRQTVCSGGCRIERSRQRRENKLQDRDAKVRLLLRTVIETAQEPKQLLEEDKL